jgi:uncharacterized protein
MPGLETTDLDSAVLGEVPGSEQFFELGMMYSSGRLGSADMVSAHKWFNIAAMAGCKGAVRLRHEIAAEMSGEIVTAQRAARGWLARH